MLKLKIFAASVRLEPETFAGPVRPEPSTAAAMPSSAPKDAPKPFGGCFSSRASNSFSSVARCFGRFLVGRSLLHRRGRCLLRLLRSLMCRLRRSLLHSRGSLLCRLRLKRHQRQFSHQAPGSVSQHIAPNS